MFTICLSLLILLALIAVAFKKRRLTVLLLSMGLLILIAVGTGRVPAELLAYLQKTPRLQQIEWKHKNAIVLLGIGIVKWPEPTNGFSTHPLGFSRIHEAARLYFQCRESTAICRILISGGDARKKGTPEAQVMQSELIEIGVKAADIVLESESNNTFQNARFTCELLRKEQYDKVVVVTSGVHLKRSLLYFSHFGVEAEGAPSDRLEPIKSLLPLSHNFTMADLALHEIVGFWRYSFYNLMGWNSESPKAGTP